MDQPKTVTETEEQLQQLQQHQAQAADIANALSRRPAQGDNAVIPIHEELELTGWRLVRHCPQGKKKFSAKDQLKGTEEYGNVEAKNGKDHPDAAEWSVRWSEDNFNEFLFSTGDGSKFMVIDRTEVDKSSDSSSGMGTTRVKASSEISSPTFVSMRKVLKKREDFNDGSLFPAHGESPTDDYVVPVISQNEEEKKGDDSLPIISLVNFDRVKDIEGSGILYVGDGNTKAGGVADSQDSSNSGIRIANNCGGANVYIRTGINLNGLAVCLNGLVGSPIEMKELYRSDNSMLELWKSAPNSIFAGLMHGFYRLDTIRWLVNALKEYPNLLSFVCMPTSDIVGSGLIVGKFATLWAAAALAIVEEVSSLDSAVARSTEVAADISLPVSQRRRLLQPAPATDELLAARKLLFEVGLHGRLFNSLRRDLKPLATVGPNFGTKEGKWYASCRATDGRIVYLPKSHPDKTILVFDPVTGTTTEIEHKKERAGVLSTKNQRGEGAGSPEEVWHYSSAVLGPNGSIFGIPSYGREVLMIKFRPGKRICHDDIVLFEVAKMSDKTKETRLKWGQGCLASNNKIYAAPFCSDQILVIDCNKAEKFKGVGNTIDIAYAKKIELLSTDTLESSNKKDENSHRWWGAVYFKESVYYIPYNRKKVLKLDIQSDLEPVEIGDEISGKEKYKDACVVNGIVVAAPWGGVKDQHNILLLDTQSEKCLFIGGFSPKYHSISAGADGRAYALAFDSSSVIQIDTTSALAADDGDEGKAEQQSDEAKGIKVLYWNSHVSHDDGNFGSATLAYDGFLYCAPMLAPRIGRIDTLREYQSRAKSGSEEADTAGLKSDEAVVGSMIWLWRSDPESWFRFLLHPSYKEEFFKWFVQNADSLVGSCGQGVGSLSQTCVNQSQQQRSNDPRWTLVVQRQVAVGRRAPADKKSKLRSAMVGPLGDVFVQWPRAGWDEQAEFDSAFDESFASADQVVVLAKNIESAAEAKRCLALLQPRVAAHGFEAHKIQGYIIGSGRVTSTPGSVVPEGVVPNGLSADSTDDFPKSESGSGLKPGDRVTFRLDSSSADWDGCPGSTLAFSAGDVNKVHEVSGAFFTTEQFKTLWAPISATTTPAKFKVGDRVKIRKVSTKEAESLQRGHGGYESSMDELLGEEGEVTAIDSDGDVRVREKVWNPMLLETVGAVDGRLRVGEKVVLATSERKGCLESGEVGTLVQDDRSSLPYQVEASSGDTYWYRESDLKRAESSTERLKVGDNVQLTARFATFGDAERGPLEPGDVAEVCSRLESCF